MIRSILFPTDFSAVANSAFPLALAVAAQYDAIVQSIHIAHGGDPHITETSRYEFPAMPTGASSVRVIETIVPKDSEDPAQIIMKQAELRTCDLIVMASHGRSDVAQFFLGRSVAERIARDSRVPTIIARLFGSRRTTRPIDRFERILYATDLSDDTRAILPVAVSIARMTGAQLETLCVFDEGDPLPADGGIGTLTSFFAEANATEMLGEFNKVRGGVAEAVVEYAAASEADLIAVTTALCCGGNPNLTETAGYIIRNAPCPVLCVRP